MTTTTFTPTEAPSVNGQGHDQGDGIYRLSGKRLLLLEWLIDNGPIRKRGRRVSGSVPQQIMRGSDLFHEHTQPSTAISGAIRTFQNHGWVEVERSEGGHTTRVEATEAGINYAATRRREIGSNSRAASPEPSPEPITFDPELDDIMPLDPFSSLATAIAAMIEEEADKRASHHSATIASIRTILHSGGSPLSMLAQIEALL